MAKRKEDLEHDVANYDAAQAQADLLLKTGEVEQALEMALSAMPYIDGMMQYRRRFEEHDFTTIHCIQIVLDIAPLLLRSDALDALAETLAAQKRIDKNTSTDLKHALSAARRRLADATRLWRHIATEGRACTSMLEQHLGGRSDDWVPLLQSWQSMSLLTQTVQGNLQSWSYASDPAAEGRAKCAGCGSIAKAPRWKFLSTARCPKCSGQREFCLLD